MQTLVIMAAVRLTFKDEVEESESLVKRLADRIELALANDEDLVADLADEADEDLGKIELGTTGPVGDQTFGVSDFNFTELDDSETTHIAEQRADEEGEEEEEEEEDEESVGLEVGGKEA